MASFSIKIQQLFSRKLFIALTFIFFLGWQVIYGFLSPSSGSDANWQPISTYLPKFSAESSDNFILSKIYPLISPKYRLNSDVGHYLELARNFFPEYFDGSPFLERPLYPFLIFLPSIITDIFIPDSYGVIFALAILVNFILVSAAVLIFFYIVKELFSLKTAWLSSILLVFSPFVHAYISQPLAEMLMVFAVTLSFYLLYNYVKKPSVLKLAIFSLIIGVLMLGKMFFATSIFILLLAFYFRRYKEGVAFFVIHLIPLLLWYLWITQVWHLTYYSLGVQGWDMGVWVFNVFHWPWYETMRAVFMAPVPGFIRALVYSFLLIPVILSIIGLRSRHFKSKTVFYFGFIFSVFILGFLVNFYYLRHVFLLFPVIYPAAVLGMSVLADNLKRYGAWYSPLFYVIIISLLIFISSVNIYRVFDYNG